MLKTLHASTLVAATVGALAAVAVLVGLPLLYSEIASIDAERVQTMHEYRERTQHLWSELMEAEAPVRHLIKRQASSTAFRQAASAGADAGFVNLERAGAGAQLSDADKRARTFVTPPHIVSKRREDIACPNWELPLTFVDEPFRRGEKVLWCGGSHTAVDCSRHRDGYRCVRRRPELDSWGLCCPVDLPETQPVPPASAVPPKPAKPADENVLFRRQVGGGASGGDNCQCSEANSCPAGPKGEPGPPGDDGMDGEPGKDGRPGHDGASAPDCPRAPCDDCPAGEPGPKGPAGPAGPAGSPGANGDSGDAGKNGDPGPAGPDGDDGGPGDDGSPGSPGQAGEDGEAGGTGEPGPKGSAGPAGPRGEKGPPGNDASDTGAPGPEGPVGPSGDRGERGADGTPGDGGVPGPIGNDAQYCPCPERNVDASVLQQQYARRRAFNFRGL